MWVFLPGLVGLVTFLVFLSRENGPASGAAGWQVSILKTSICGGVFVAVVTETLSLFHWLTLAGVLSAWGLALTGLLAWSIYTHALPAGLQKIREGFQTVRFSPLTLSLAGVILIYLVCLVAIAWLAPPNTNDSLAYHLPRVMHWIENNSVAHYFTAIPRQLWNPPGAEYFILHTILLAGSDRWANFVQLGCLLGCLVGVGLIAKQLNISPKGQWIAIIFCLTVPMVIMQATSTQNDLVTAFWVVCSIYWIVLASRRPLSGWEWLFLSASLGLGILTKGTFYAFSLPFLIWLLVIVFRREGWRSVAKYGAVGLAAVVVLNSGIWLRNLQAYRMPLGPPGEISSLANQDHSPAGVGSILIRNVVYQVAAPSPKVNQILTDGVIGLLSLLKTPIDAPATTLTPFTLELNLTSEDYATNPLHFCLIGLSIGLVFLQSKRAPAVLVYALAAAGVFVLFSALYKWQSTGSRLLTPFFVLAAPLAGAVVDRFNSRWVFTGLVAVFSVSGLLPLLANQARPLAPIYKHPALWVYPRLDGLFTNSPENRVAYIELSRWVEEANCKQLGLIMDSHDIEYPLWAILSPSGKETRIEHLDLLHPLPAPGENGFRPCAILITLYDYNTDRLTGYQLAESRLGFQLYFLRKQGSSLR